MSTDVIRLDLPASLRYLNVLGSCVAEILGRADLSLESEQTVYNITLAIQEACTGIVNQAYAGEAGRIGVTITLVPQTQLLTIDLEDTACNTFDMSAPDMNGSQEKGAGLWLVGQLMDEVTYYSRRGEVWRSETSGSWQRVNDSVDDKPSGGNLWQLVKKL